MRRLLLPFAILVAACSPQAGSEVALPDPGAIWPGSADIGGETVSGPQLIDRARSLLAAGQTGDYATIYRSKTTPADAGTVVRIEAWLKTPGGRDVARVTVIQGAGDFMAEAGDSGFMTADDLR